jgi:hypothetical protein
MLRDKEIENFEIFFTFLYLLTYDEFEIKILYSDRVDNSTSTIF